MVGLSSERRVRLFVLLIAASLHVRIYVSMCAYIDMCMRKYVCGAREQVTEARPVGDGAFAYTIRNGDNTQVPCVCAAVVVIAVV